MAKSANASSKETRWPFDRRKLVVTKAMRIAPTNQAVVKIAESQNEY